MANRPCKSSPKVRNSLPKAQDSLQEVRNALPKAQDSLQEVRNALPKVRNATLLDLPAIMEIEKASFVKEIRESEKTYTERISVFGDGCFVLETDDFLQNARGLDATPIRADARASENSQKVVGFFSSELWALSKDNKIDTNFELNHSCQKANCTNGEILYISSFALLPICRGKNLGKFFFEQAINALHQKYPQIKMLALHVNVEWKSAIHIYEKFGFVTQELVKSCFPSCGENQTQDGLFMTKTL